MSYADESCKAAVTPPDSSIMKQLECCFNEVERLHSNISMLKDRLSPVMKVAEETTANPKVATIASTKVGEAISSLEGRIDSASRKVSELFNLVEV